MAFSSTVIVIKLLTGRRELEQLHGRIALGILIVQDTVVVVIMGGSAPRWGRSWPAPRWPRPATARRSAAA
jgi:hypothetical protein